MYADELPVFSSIQLTLTLPAASVLKLRPNGAIKCIIIIIIIISGFSATILYSTYAAI